MFSKIIKKILFKVRLNYKQVLFTQILQCKNLYFFTFILSYMSYTYISFFFSVQLHSLPITLKMGREKIKENFLKNKDVTDIRVIDLLVAKVN